MPAAVVVASAATPPSPARAAIVEPLLDASSNRFVVFPIKHHDVWDFYKRAVSSFWTPEEVDVAKDIADWERLTDGERHFVKHVLAFFAASDGIVNDNLAARFMHEVTMPEAKSFYSFQIAIESIHAETYSLLIDAYIKDRDEQARLFDAVNGIPCIKRKADWALRWIEDADAPFAQRLLAFAIVEGVFFSGAFCAIYWLKERGVMPGLCFSNDLISRDEALHTEFAVLLYNEYVEAKLTTLTVHEMVREAVDLEKVFVTDALPCQLLGMSGPQMSQYVEFVADRLLQQIGAPKLYGGRNPFQFMERISVESKANFFETRVAEYSIANVSRPAKFVVHEDF